MTIIADDILRFNQSDNILIECIGEGYPKKDIIWQFINKNSTILLNQTVYFNDTQTNNKLLLALDNIQKNSQGFYECSTQDQTIKQRIQIIVQSNQLKLKSNIFVFLNTTSFLMKRYHHSQQY